MAELLGAASGVAGLLSLSGVILSKGYTYFSSARGAPEELRCLLNEVAALNIVLSQLNLLAASTHAKNSTNSGLLGALSSLSGSGAIDHCRVLLEAVERSIKSCEQLKGEQLNNLRKKLIFPFKEKEVKDTLQRLGSLRETFTAAISVDTMATVQRVEKRVGDMIDDLRDEKRRRISTDNTMVATRLLIEKGNSDQERRKIFNWLTMFDHQVNHRLASILKQEGTGQWLLNGDRFKNWLHGDDTFLWLHGIAGAGKTILASTVINETARHCKQSSQTLGLAFFYCDFNNSASLDPTILFGSLVAQLAAQTEDVPNAIRELYERKLDQKRGIVEKLYLEDLAPLLPVIAGEFDRSYVIVDGLDECSNRQVLLDALVKLDAPSNHPKLHLMFTSRRELDIERTFKQGSALCIQNAEVACDVELHVKSEIERRTKLKKLPDQWKSRIVQEMVNGAEGMFRWVQCQLDTLCQAPTLAAMSRMLRDLPVGLDKTYERIISNIEEPVQEMARKMFLWLVCSESPMTTTELAEAIIIESDMATLDSYTRLLDFEELSKIGGSFITIEKVDTAGAAIVKLAHYSVKEYLLSSRIRGSKTTSKFSITMQSGHRELATMCLTYLSLDNFEDGPYRRWTDVQRCFENYPMLSYATRNWGHHSRKGLVDANSKWYGKVFCTSHAERFRTFAQMCDWSRWMWWPDPDNQQPYPDREPDIGLGPGCVVEPLYYLAEAGAARLVESVLDGGAVVDSFGGMYGSSLQTAAYNGHKEVVGLLLEHGADANLRVGLWGTALLAAIVKGHTDVVQLLLVSGAYVDFEVIYDHFQPHHGQDPDDGQTPIRLAAMQGHPQIVQMLLNHGADIEGRGISGETALQVAARYGRRDVVKLLLERGSDVNTEGDPKWCGNALNWAASSGNKEVVSLLLANKADINAQCGRYGSALTTAATCGQSGIVELLLGLGVDIDAPAGKCGPALAHAAKMGETDVVRLLLINGANIDAPGGKYGSVLTAAARGGNKEIVQLLLDLGADIHVPSKKYGNVLQAAAMTDNLELVRLLLGRGADVMINTCGGLLGNALQAAARYSGFHVTQLFLDWGAEVNAQGGKFGSALQAAVRSSKTDVVRLLLDHGAELNSQGGKFGNSLQAAARYSEIDLVEFLLAQGAEVNAQGGKFGNALQTAAQGSNIDLVKLLLDWGADINAQGGKFGNALQAAVRGSKIDVVRLLLDHGAEVNAQGGKFGSALQAAARYSNMEVVELLIDHNADVNAQGGRFGNALQAAIRSSIFDLQQVLYNHGVGVHTHDVGLRHILQAAASTESERKVRLILARGAEVNAQGGEFGNALQAAVACSGIDMVRLLLGQGADVNAQGGAFGHALQAAALGMDERIVRILLDQGANVNAQGGEYGNALQAAARYSNISVVHLLLERGAEVNARGGVYTTALQAAQTSPCRSKKRLAVIAILAEYGAG